MIAVSYGTFVAAILWLTSGNSKTLWDSVGIALSGSTAINLIFLGLFYVGWKWLWAKFPVLNRLLYPNLAGEWDIKIHWNGDNTNGIAIGVAHITQTFLKVSMEVVTEKSESETLCATPAKDPESGRPILYYLYRVIPRQINNEPGEAYEGSAILKLDHGSFSGLRGNYFTSRQTKGYFEISRKT